MRKVLITFILISLAGCVHHDKPQYNNQFDVYSSEHLFKDWRGEAHILKCLDDSLQKDYIETEDCKQ